MHLDKQSVLYRSHSYGSISHSVKERNKLSKGGDISLVDKRDRMRFRHGKGDDGEERDGRQS